MENPEPWEIRLSNTKNLIYFYNSTSKESCWTPPNGYSKEKVKGLKGADKYEEEVEKMFKGEKDQVRASHLLVKHKDSRRPSSWKEAKITRTKEEAIEILQKYKDEINDAPERAEKFAELAKEHSDCASHSNGGDLGWFGRDQMQKAFETATYDLEIGAVSGIVETDSGVHLIFQSFPLGLLKGKPDLLYTGIATATLAALLIVVFNRKTVAKPAETPKTDKPTKEVRVRSGKMAPPAGSIKVAKLLVHPIKSCRGTSVQSARYTPKGMEGDRRFCIIDATNPKVITAREVPKMVLITPRIQVDESSPDGGLLVVSFPEDSGCESFSVPLRPSEETLSTWTLLKNIIIWPECAPLDGYICQSSVKGAPSPSEVLSKYFGKPVHLSYKGPDLRAIEATYDFPDLKANAYFQDMYPLLILSEESAPAVDEQIRPLVGKQGINERWGDAKVRIERFRPNIVLSGGGPFAEDDWEEIGIGSANAPTITLVSKCTRCLLPNVDPETGLKDAAVPYKVIMKFRKGLDPAEKMKPCVGCNAVPSGEGVVSVGDDIYVKKMW
ncbi:hypothetical protein NP233_g1216 [Leucocoprinus birnbaumii]|uniref:peptidylprolyl isomerase n=1 Tax=Leucocoprinus birnbaumii TaxID=56174 RepID=A0AAD5YZQ3_9AGAR|nr:hypothetical protein NP233_g1216 [Leucocoprinus birnbaumii]